MAVAVVPKGDTPRFRTSTPKRLAWGTHPTPWSAHPRRSLATDPHQEQPQGQVHAPTCVGKNRGRLFVGDDILGGQEWMDGPTTHCSSLQHRFVHVARGGMDLRGGASPQGPHAFNACHAYMQPPCMSGSILQGGGCHLCQRRARLRCLGRRNSVQLQLPVTVPARHATALCHPAWHGPAMASTPLLPTQVAMWGTGGMRAHPPGSCGDPQLSALWSLQ